jgi:hypothetical protein
MNALVEIQTLFTMKTPSSANFVDYSVMFENQKVSDKHARVTHLKLMESADISDLVEHSKMVILAPVAVMIEQSERLFLPDAPNARKLNKTNYGFHSNG